MKINKQPYKNLLSLHFVKRWNGENLDGHKRSISEHTYEVSYISRLIIENSSSMINYKDKYDIMSYSIVHDFPESIFGDIKLETKLKYKDLNNSLKLIEKEWFTENLKHYNEFPSVVKYIVKCSDIICVAIEILEDSEKSKNKIYQERLINMFKDNEHKFMASEYSSKEKIIQKTNEIVDDFICFKSY